MLQERLIHPSGNLWNSFSVEKGRLDQVHLPKFSEVRLVSPTEEGILSCKLVGLRDGRELIKFVLEKDMMKIGVNYDFNGEVKSLEAGVKTMEIHPGHGEISGYSLLEIPLTIENKVTSGPFSQEFPIVRKWESVWIDKGEPVYWRVEGDGELSGYINNVFDILDEKTKSGYAILLAHEGGWLVFRAAFEEDLLDESPLVINCASIEIPDRFVKLMDETVLDDQQVEELVKSLGDFRQLIFT